MNKIYSVIIILFIGTNLFGQDLNDLIITKNQDSIKCKITLVNDANIFYQYKKKKNIKSTFISRDLVLDFQGNNLEKNTITKESIRQENNCDTCVGQGFKTPKEGKAIVYFTRVSTMGSMLAFDFFHQEKYLGKIRTNSYLRYECDPGEQLFWASAENKAFLTADLKSGETYIVIVDVKMGLMSGRVGLSPITRESELFKRAESLVLNTPPIVGDEKFIAKNGERLEHNGWIKDKLNHYETKLKGTDLIRNISPEMFIPKEFLNK